METIKYRVIADSSEENIIVTSNGNVACIRETFDGADAPRVATTEYYQMPLTEIDKSLINEEECVDVWTLLGEGKMYYNDWNKDQVEDHNDPKLVEDCLQWFGGATEFVRDDTIQTDFFPID